MVHLADTFPGVDGTRCLTWTIFLAVISIDAGNGGLHYDVIQPATLTPDNPDPDPVLTQRRAKFPGARRTPGGGRATSPWLCLTRALQIPDGLPFTGFVVLTGMLVYPGSTTKRS